MKLPTTVLMACVLGGASLAHAQGAGAPPNNGVTLLPTQADVRAVAPALERYEQGTIFGNLWRRPDLSPRDRSIVTLSALIARNQAAEMPRYLGLALDSGVKPGELSGLITHLAFYSGWGNAMSAVSAAKEVFAARNIGVGIVGWEVIGTGGIDYVGTDWPAAQGNRSLDLNGSPGVGGIAQTFDTVPDQTYHVQFDMAGHFSGLLQEMRVSAADQHADFLFHSGTDQHHLGWEHRDWEFTAHSTSTTISFQSLQDEYQYGGPTLDNVSIWLA